MSRTVKIDGRLVFLWRAVDAEGEVLDVLGLLRIAAHVGEGEYRDGGTVGQREGRARRLRDFIGVGPAAYAGWSTFDWVRTSPTKRSPLRAIVRIRAARLGPVGELSNRNGPVRGFPR